MSLAQHFGYRAGKFIGVGKRDSYPLRLQVADEQVRSSIALMGNAAHFLHQWPAKDLILCCGLLCWWIN